MRSRILALTCWWVLRSLARRSRASVKLRDASSLCILSPQFWLRALASSSVYSCTLALRWASRLIMAATACCAPVSAEPTLSHTSRMYSQFSLVRFSSVALTTTSSNTFDCARNMAVYLYCIVLYRIVCLCRVLPAGRGRMLPAGGEELRGSGLWERCLLREQQVDRQGEARRGEARRRLRMYVSYAGGLGLGLGLGSSDRARTSRSVLWGKSEG